MSQVQSSAGGLVFYFFSEQVYNELFSVSVHTRVASSVSHCIYFTSVPSGRKVGWCWGKGIIQHAQWAMMLLM